jgi:hypothetical protein
VPGAVELVDGDAAGVFVCGRAAGCVADGGGAGAQSFPALFASYVWKGMVGEWATHEYSSNVVIGSSVSVTMQSRSSPLG